MSKANVHYCILREDGVRVKSACGVLPENLTIQFEHAGLNKKKGVTCKKCLKIIEKSKKKK